MNPIAMNSLAKSQSMILRFKSLCGLIAAGAFLTLGTTAANAQLTLIDDFEGFSNGNPLNGATTWSGGGGYTAVTDPDDATNMVARFPVGTAATPVERILDFDPGTTGDQPMTNGQTATLFYQFRVDTTAALNDLDQGFGAAGSGDAFQNYRAYTPIRTGRIQYRDGGSFATAEASPTVGTWYSTWVVLDQGSGANGTYDLYLETGRTATRGTAIATGIDFRSDSGAEVDRFLFRNGGSTGTNADGFFDNLYLDTSGDNATNPIPEPSSYALLFGLLAAGFATRRRRSRV